MRRKILALMAAALLALMPIGAAMADQQGYEGQPGNQSEGGHGGDGLHGYEGQPGNQGGH